MQDLTSSVKQASDFLKGLASPHRLTLLCLLSEGDKNVSELVQASGLQQTSVSQHLAKLKAEGIVDYKRHHRILTYYIVSPLAHKILADLHQEFCSTPEHKTDTTGENHDENN